jgi:hypothetical protein
VDWRDRQRVQVSRGVAGRETAVLLVAMTEVSVHASNHLNDEMLIWSTVQNETWQKCRSE